MHVSNNSYGMYSAEAYARWHSYPPPYNGTSYATPWLWLDGDPHAAYIYTNWGNLISARMNIVSPVNITMWGDYNPITRTGTIYAKYYNETSEVLSGNVLFVVTEDSIQRSTPNGDLWHNHVARDYIPNHLGVAYDIAGNDSIVYSQPFTIASNWNVNQCEIVTFFQNTRLTADSVKEIYQGAKIMVRDLTVAAIEENNNSDIFSSSVKVAPNPCPKQTQFILSLPNGTDYKISIFDISGREVKTLSGKTNSIRQIINCELTNTVKTGVYFYRFQSNTVNTNGKIIVQ